MRTQVHGQVRAAAERARRERLRGPQIIQQAAGGGGVAAIRLAKAQESAQDDQYISCKLLDANGDVGGSAFDVRGLVMGTDPDAPLNECTPRVFEGDSLWIATSGDQWYFLSPFDADTPCECEEPAE